MNPEVNSEDIIFEASNFLDLLFSSGDIEKKIHELQERPSLNIVFIVPGKAVNNWMSDSNNLALNFDDICFLTFKGEDKENAISLSGTGVTIYDNKVELFLESVNAEKVDLKDQNDLSEKLNFTGPTTTCYIHSSFSINTDELKGKVLVIDSEKLPLRNSRLLDEDHNSSQLAASVDSLILSPFRKENHPGREILLRKLKDPSCLPIIKEIKRMLKFLLLPKISVDEKALKLQKFYQDLRETMIQNVAWKDSTNDEIDSSLDAMERYICSKSHNAIYRPFDTDDEVQDRLFLEKTAALVDLPFSALCSDIDLSSFNLGEDSIPASQHLLTKISQLDTPMDKLDFLKAVIRDAGLLIQDSGSDTLIPYLVWFVIRNVPETLISDIRYIQRFRNHTMIKGESSFCLTNMVAVITTIERLHAEQVSKTDPIYSLLASQESISKIPTTNTNEPEKSIAFKTPPESPSVATTFINTIGFVPRAIGSAVADTFRSRSIRAQSSQVVSETQSIPNSPPILHSSIILPKAKMEIRLLRNKVRSLRREDFELLTMKELKELFLDYQDILKVSSPGE